MLFVPGCELRSIVDNYGSTLSDIAFGTSVTSHTSTANLKGTPVILISGSSVISDVFGISIIFVGGSSSNSIRRFLADLLVDYNGGSSWSILINDLFVNNPHIVYGGYRYFFPIYLPAGTSIGLRQQCNLANTSLRCGVKLYGKPSRPELYRCGTKVETFGAVTSTTSGTAITPGTSTLGTFTNLATLSFDQFWWQWGGIGYNESVFVANTVMGDVACGTALGNLISCVEGCMQSYNGTEQAGKSAFGVNLPIRDFKSGLGIYVRASCSLSPETTPTTTAYGLG